MDHCRNDFFLQLRTYAPFECSTHFVSLFWHSCGVVDGRGWSEVDWRLLWEFLLWFSRGLWKLLKMPWSMLSAAWNFPILLYLFNLVILLSYSANSTLELLLKKWMYVQSHSNYWYDHFPTYRNLIMSLFLKELLPFEHLTVLHEIL